MLASVAYEATVGPHGFDADVAFDPATYPKVTGHRSIDYVSKAIDEFKESMRKKFPDDKFYGSVWYATVDD